MNIENRLFSIKKKTRALFVSSSNSKEPASGIISIVANKAVELNCNLVAHAGWSFRTTKKESTLFIIDNVSKSIRDTPIDTYVCEIENDQVNETLYHIFLQRRGRISHRQCLEQKIEDSSEIDEIMEFVSRLDSTGPKKVAEKEEYPCILAICGENNLFNQECRGNKIARIKAGSVSDRGLSNLTRIQNREWCVINPSHKLYRGFIVPKSIMTFHRSCSSDKRVKYLITGNNWGHLKPKSKINHPLVWKNGIPHQMKLVYDDNKALIYIHFYQL